MWVRIDDWMVIDDQISLARRGQLIRGLGLCTRYARLIDPPLQTEGLIEFGGGQKPTTGQQATYRCTGTVFHAEDVEADIGSGSFHAGCELATMIDEDLKLLIRLDQHAARFPVGSRVTFDCTFIVIAAYEWSDFDLPDVRTDYRLLQLHHPEDDQSAAYFVELAPITST
jgi:hypothetical protein